MCAGACAPRAQVDAPAPPEALRLDPGNPHYLRWRGTPTIVVTSGEHYGAVLNLDFALELRTRQQ